MSNVDTWSQVAGENADPVPDYAPQGHQRTQVNDITREAMSAIRRAKENSAWFDKLKGPSGLGFTITRMSDFQVRLTHESTPTDATAKLVVGTRVRIGDGSTYVYGFVAMSLYANPDTFVGFDFDGASVLQATPTTIENHVTDNYIGKAAFSPLGAALSQDPPEVPSIDHLGDGATLDQGAGNGFDADTVDGAHASDIISAAASALGVGLINGNFAIGQRGHTINDTTYYLNDNAEYVVDGWALLMGKATSHPASGSGVVNIDLIAANATGGRADSRAVRITGNSNVGVSPVEKIGLIQWLPFDVVESLRSGSVSLSVWARIPSSGFQELRLAIVEWSGAADLLSPGVDPINDWGDPGVLPTVGGSYSISVADSQTVSGTWTEFKYENVSISGSTNNLAVLIYMDDTAWASGNIFELTGVSLVRGAAARPYSHEDYSLNLRRCQRFFNSTFPEGDTPTANNGSETGALRTTCTTGNGDSSMIWEYGTSMFKKPTVTAFNPTVGAGSVDTPRNVTSGNNSTRNSSYSSERRVVWDLGDSGDAQGDQLVMHATADASL